MDNKDKFDQKGIPRGAENAREMVLNCAAEMLGVIQASILAPGANSESNYMFSLAKQKLEETVMWFNKGLSRMNP